MGLKVITSQEKLRILAVSYEPAETLVLESILRQLNTRPEIEECLLIVSDGWQHWYSPAREALLDLVHNSPVSIQSLGPVFDGWQKGRPAENLTHLQEWGDRNCIQERSLHQVLQTDFYRARWERRPFYRPISNAWLNRIAGDMARSIDEYLDEFGPNLVVSTWLSGYLFKNMLFEAARARGIETRYLLHTRLDNLVQWRDDFGLGTSASAVQGIRGLGRDRSYDEKDLSYTGLTNSHIETLKQQRARPVHAVPSLLDDALRSIGRIVRALKRGEIEIRSPRGFSSWWRVIVYELLVASRKMRYAFLGIPKALNDIGDIPSPYVYFPLHLRSESHVASAAASKDESVLIADLATQLPENTFLLVKENPLMVGERRASFYRRILRSAKVRLVDPTVDSKEIIAGSVAVASIAGTAMLEGAQLGKPSVAYGFTEFIAALEPFFLNGGPVKDSIHSRVDISRVDVQDYVRWCRTTGFPFVMASSDILNNSVLRERAACEAAARLMKSI